MNKGFTLIEIMVSLFILTAGMTGILSLFLTGSAISQYSVNSIEAASLLDEVLADLAANYKSKYFLPNNQIQGYPAKYEELNSGNVDNMDIALIPQGWAGTSGELMHPTFDYPETASRTGLLRKGMTYSIYYRPLPNTRNFLTKEIQCVLAEVSVKWRSKGKEEYIVGHQVVFIK
ncbi:MAG: prepilin-type N-terminal cleavage/methylation domain-containing protein [Planctomycetes bacterium]|nr:prepilin-type N-terminal cleavage/methylation domain-containing protein [Planctomycetota bacterium]